MMPNPIHPKQRAAVRLRDGDRCLRCGGRGTDCHHRRGRAVKDSHTHCTCVLVTLCRTCHDYVHASPGEAMGHGWIVSRYMSEPTIVLLDTAQWGWVQLTCCGDVVLSERRETPDEGVQDLRM